MVKKMVNKKISFIKKGYLQIILGFWRFESDETNDQKKQLKALINAFFCDAHLMAISTG